jgi:hypothetical protein
MKSKLEFPFNLLSPADNILLPSSTSFNTVNNNAQVEPPKKQIPIGSTWAKDAGSLNIDFDNLVGKKSSKGPAPSMNQLKSANTSPVKANTNVMHTQSNNNFNFNAFQ